MSAKRFTLKSIMNEIYGNALRYRNRPFSEKLPRGLTVGAKIEKNGQSVFYIFREGKFPSMTEWKTSIKPWGERPDYSHLDFFRFPVVEKIDDKNRYYLYVRYNGGKRIDSGGPDTRQPSYWDGKE